MSEWTPPSPTSVARLLTDLLGRQVSARTSREPEDPSAAAVATYTNGDGGIGAICTCTMGVAASLGAALTMVPPDQAQACVAANKLEGMVLENFQEVCNVVVTVLNESSQTTLSLADLFTAPPAPTDVTSLVGTAERQAHLTVSVDGYSDGGMSLVLT